jgi:hypothetical protein
MIKLIAGEFSVDKAAADGEGKRTISGVAVPYNVFATGVRRQRNHVNIPQRRSCSHRVYEVKADCIASCRW